MSADDGSGFDRFFTDRRTRIQLNQAREQYRFISPGVNTSVDEAQELVLPDVKFNGMIIREDGSTEVWVNSTGSAHDEAIGDKIKVSARRTKDDRVRVTLPSGETVNLKPGQVYSMETERVREAYEQVRPELPPPKNKAEEKPESQETAESSEKAQPEEKQKVEFDEAELAEGPDSKIRLLEERIEKLEKQ